MIPHEENNFYEEGTFTPKIGGYSNDGSVGDVIYRVNDGTYKKIGNAIFVDFKMAITSIQNMKGNLALFRISISEQNS